MRCDAQGTVAVLSQPMETCVWVRFEKCSRISHWQRRSIILSTELVMVPLRLLCGTSAS